MAENGLALAKFFESHPKVEKVYYPGLESSPSKALADKQFEGNGYGGMLCVNFKGGQKEIDKLISNLQLVRFVPTLAGVGTTLTYPPRASHRDLSPDPAFFRSGGYRRSAERLRSGVGKDVIQRKQHCDFSKEGPFQNGPSFTRRQIGYLATA